MNKIITDISVTPNQHIQSSISPVLSPVLSPSSTTEFNTPSCIVSPTCTSPDATTLAHHIRDDTFQTISESSICTSTTSSSSLSDFIDELDSQPLYKFGYKVINTISDTPHATIYQAKMIKQCNNRGTTKLVSQTSSIARGLLSNKVTIKQVAKDKMNVLMDGKNILKEAQLLYYLTIQNKAISDNMCSFIEFIETETDYYLIEEYNGSMTLAQFTCTAHKYIKQKKLKIKQWRTVVKYVFWQLVVNVFWLHNDMNVAHLNLNMDNIMIETANFIEHKENGSVSIDTTKLTVKICDLEYSEVFPFEMDKKLRFQCVKSKLTKKYKSPKELAKEIFDARKVDSWSLGFILFKMFTGELPYKNANSSDIGYAALHEKRFIEYVQKRNLFLPKSVFSVIKGLLNFNEDERMSVYDVLNDDWFKHYYLKYKSRINQKSKIQTQRHMARQKEIKTLPFYCLNSCVL